jgi:hypothetical protein
MHPSKVARLQAQGWRVGTAAEWLGLTEVDVAMIDIRLALTDGIRARMRARKMRRARRDRGKHVKPSRASRAVPTPMEDSIRMLIELGATRKDIARIISSVAS